MKALPEVAMEWPVNLFETVAVGRVDGNVELCYGAKSSELCGVLGITDEEGRDFARVEQAQEFIDLNSRAMSAIVHTMGG